MRRKKVKEQLFSIITLCSVFIFFIYLKTNPDISSTSLSSEIVEMKNLENENAVEVKLRNEENRQIIGLNQLDLKPYFDRIN